MYTYTLFWLNYINYTDHSIEPAHDDMHQPPPLRIPPFRQPTHIHLPATHTDCGAEISTAAAQDTVTAAWRHMVERGVDSHASSEQASTRATRHTRKTDVIVSNAHTHRISQSRGGNMQEGKVARNKKWMVNNKVRRPPQYDFFNQKSKKTKLD